LYSPLVVEQEQSLLEKRLGFKLKRYDVGYSVEVQAHLEDKLQKLAELQPDITPEQAFQKLTAEEKAFVRNERLLCSLDFDYWKRYAWLMPDASVSDGNLVRFEPWDSQEIILREAREIELRQYTHFKAGEPSDGVLLVVPKARQEGISLLAAMVKMHRLCTSPFTLAITATENEDKRISLYNRDIRIWDKLPWYLKPERTAPDLQAVRLTFGKLESSLVYQDYMQEGSLAAGEQFLIGHMSELAQGDHFIVSKMMTLDYFPAIPQSWRAFHLLESTPTSMGNWWHSFVMDQVLGKDRWKVKFIPWYALGIKYRRIAPVDWLPSQHTREHARKVEETSAGYVGKQVILSRDQLYWWETTREEHRKGGKLPHFLTNYPATLEESFQSYNTSIWDYETIEFYRNMTRVPGGTYQIVERVQ
jgi:hypothetical protein